jgi:tetratricopeptide (TPR) repeat protein
MRRLPWRRVLVGVIVTGLFTPIIPAQKPTPSSTAAERLIRSARKAELQQDYATAATAYEKLAALRPKDPLAHQSLGLAWYLQGSYAKAVNPLEHALKLDPGLLGSRLYLGICYYRTNQFQKAVDSLKVAERAKANEPMALYWLGASQLALKNPTEATAKLERASTLSPKDPEVLNTLARAYADYSGFLFERLLQTAPHSGSARLVRAEDFWRENLAQPALELLSEAAEGQPELPGLHLAAGQILWQERKFEEAAEEFRKELTVDPASPEAHRRLAGYYQSSNTPEKATGHLDQLAKLNADDVSTGATAPVRQSAVSPVPASGIDLKSAGAQYAKGEIGPAIEDLKLRLKTNPGDVSARRLLVRCLLVREQLQSAVSALQELLKIRPNDSEATYLLAKSYEALSSQVVQKMVTLEPDSYRVRLLRGEAHEKSARREYAEALAEYLQALKLRPDTPGISFAAGRILWKMNRFDEAVSHLEKELALNRHHGLANYYLGNIFLSRAEYEKALTYLDAALRAQPGLIQAHRDRGRALASLKRYDEAIHTFQKVVEANPEDSSIHALMVTSYRAMGRLEDAKRSALIVQELSEKRRRMPGK